MRRRKRQASPRLKTSEKVGGYFTFTGAFYIISQEWALYREKSGAKKQVRQMGIQKNLFIALPVPKDAQKELLGLEAIFPGRSFSRNLHLTLFFIGPGKEPEAFAACLEGVRGRAFELNLADLGTFGNKILWAGLEPCSALMELQGKIVQIMRSIGLAPDKGIYRPHITLCRLKSPLSAGERNRLAGVKNKGGWLAEHFCLYESELLPTGAIHRVIKTFPLKD